VFAAGLNERTTIRVIVGIIARRTREIEIRIDESNGQCPPAESVATELLEDELQAELKTRSLTHFQLTLH